MTTSTLNGWFLGKQASGETSLRLTFFTQEQGIVRCLYKGGRTPKKQAVLQPFKHLWLALDERRDWHFVRHIEHTGPALDLKGQALFSGLYLNELLYHALKPFDPSSQLYSAYHRSLEVLAVIEDKFSLEAQLRRFEWTLLKACGYAMSLTEDVRAMCPIDSNESYQFVAGEGFHAADKGILGRHILAMADDNLEHEETLKAAKYLMRQAIDHLLDGREIKARALFAIKPL